jgi:hypothetical protein
MRSPRSVRPPAMTAREEIRGNQRLRSIRAIRVPKSIPGCLRSAPVDMEDACNASLLRRFNLNMPFNLIAAFVGYGNPIRSRGSLNGHFMEGLCFA